MSTRELVLRLLNEVSELRKEVKGLHGKIETKVDSAINTVKDAFEGFGILDPEEDTWTTKQVCENYHVSPRSLNDWRRAGLISFSRVSDSPKSKIRYRKADIIEFFAARNS